MICKLYVDTGGGGEGGSLGPRPFPRLRNSGEKRRNPHFLYLLRKRGKGLGPRLPPSHFLYLLSKRGKGLGPRLGGGGGGGAEIVRQKSYVLHEINIRNHGREIQNQAFTSL